MKKLLSLFVFATLLTFVAPAQLSRNFITKTFTLTATTNTAAYGVGTAINSTTANTTTSHSVDIGIPYTSLVGLDIATTHTGTPLVQVQLFTGSVTIAGDNKGTATLTPTQLTNTWLGAVPISSVASISGSTALAPSASYSPPAIPTTIQFSGKTAYFFIQNTGATVASPSAQYFIRFTFRKD